MNTIEIQFFDTFSWRTYARGVPNVPTFIVATMREASRSYPDRRIRAVTDSEATVVDIL